MENRRRTGKIKIFQSMYLSYPTAFLLTLAHGLRPISSRRFSSILHVCR